jgi:hypothetical protein
MVFINKYLTTTIIGEQTVSRRIPSGVVIEHSPSNNSTIAVFNITVSRARVVDEAIEQLICVLSDEPSVLKLPLR